jgi:hypothetical protein
MSEEFAHEAMNDSWPFISRLYCSGVMPGIKLDTDIRDLLTVIYDKSEEYRK